jgi:hypothetical protein
MTLDESDNANHAKEEAEKTNNDNMNMMTVTLMDL